jgi:enamine deaminase RidA (YjgF/YER057c/UK114 family)
MQLQHLQALCHLVLIKMGYIVSITTYLLNFHNKMVNLVRLNNLLYQTACQLKLNSCKPFNNML